MNDDIIRTLIVELFPDKSLGKYRLPVWKKPTIKRDKFKPHPNTLVDQVLSEESLTEPEPEIDLRVLRRETLSLINYWERDLRWKSRRGMDTEDLEKSIEQAHALSRALYVAIGNRRV